MDTTRPGRWIRDRVIDDLKLMIKDTEDLLRNTGQQAGEGYQAARARLETTLGSAKNGLSTLSSGSREALDSTDQYVQEHPWQSVGIGALAGLALGLWLGRR